MKKHKIGHSHCIIRFDKSCIVEDTENVLDYFTIVGIFQNTDLGCVKTECIRLNKVSVSDDIVYIVQPLVKEYEVIKDVMVN